MNEELLKTPAVKSAVEHYLKIGLKFEEIKERLIDIHLIIVDDDVLFDFVDEIKQGAKSK
jgi:hypothetical protein